LEHYEPWKPPPPPKPERPDIPIEEEEPDIPEDLELDEIELEHFDDDPAWEQPPYPDAVKDDQAQYEGTPLVITVETPQGDIMITPDTPEQLNNDMRNWDSNSINLSGNSVKNTFQDIVDAVNDSGGTSTTLKNDSGAPATFMQSLTDGYYAFTGISVTSLTSLDPNVPTIYQVILEVGDVGSTVTTTIVGTGGTNYTATIDDGLGQPFTYDINDEGVDGYDHFEWGD
jgi:hypothetical protein